MKTLFHTVLLFISICANSNVAIAAQPIIGPSAWLNKYSNTIIKLDQQSDGLYIKGIHSYDKWSFFEYYGGNIFIDKNGNRITVKNPNTLVYRSRLNKRKLTFKKMQNVAQHETYFENNFGNQNQYTETNPNSRPPIHSTGTVKPEGTWYISSIQKYLYITETREGLKARIRDNKEWFSYTRIGNSSSEFISNTGSKYILQKDGTMIWMKAGGRDRLILQKISSEFE
ncbi:MAG: hypothetical protein IPM42_00790 [Saprospiraceae bacterium]|nr:hypothetical protein [Saprospiraceae bacterium]